jgi:hypothetical protein
MTDLLGVLHWYGPKQYAEWFPKFCSPMTIMEITEITKYMYAGVHKLRNPTRAIIVYVIKYTYIFIHLHKDAIAKNEQRWTSIHLRG